MSIEDHNAHQVILKDSGQSVFGTGNEDSVHSVNDTHNLICRVLCSVTDIFKSDIVLPKSEFIAKYKSSYSEEELRHAKIFCLPSLKAKVSDFTATSGT